PPRLHDGRAGGRHLRGGARALPDGPETGDPDDLRWGRRSDGGRRGRLRVGGTGAPRAGSTGASRRPTLRGGAQPGGCNRPGLQRLRPGANLPPYDARGGSVRRGGRLLHHARGDDECGGRADRGAGGASPTLPVHPGDPVAARSSGNHRTIRERRVHDVRGPNTCGRGGGDARAFRTFLRGRDGLAATAPASRTATRSTASALRERSAPAPTELGRSIRDERRRALCGRGGRGSGGAGWPRGAEGRFAWSAPQDGGRWGNRRPERRERDPR